MEAIRSFFDGAKRLWWLGYVLTVIVSLGWFVHWRWFKARQEWEIDRLAEERNRWQKATYELKNAIGDIASKLPGSGGGQEVMLSQNDEGKPRIVSSTETPQSPTLFDTFGEE